MSFLVTWIVLAALWIGLSGYLDVVHLTFGFCSVTLVSALTHKFMTGGRNVGEGLTALVRLFLYVPWLLWQVFLANIDVLLRVFGFREVDPCVIRFTPDLHTDFGKVTLANSITLTPGTVTVDLEGDEFIVHAISREAADAVLKGAMERKAKSIEGEGASDA